MTKAKVELSVEYHKTKLLLEIYRTVVWRLESAIHEINETADDYGGRRISELMDFLEFELEDYDFGKDKKALEERLMSIRETKQIIECVDKAVAFLKTHPKHGNEYHEIITCCYINKDKVKDEQIWTNLNISEKTYYRHKRKALEDLGVALWGFIIQPLRSYWEKQQSRFVVKVTVK